jgi:RND family efflux transporter MFP subunit
MLSAPGGDEDETGVIGKRRRRRRQAVDRAVFLTSMTVGAALMSAAPTAQGQPMMARGVEVAEARFEEVAPTIRLVGTVRPRLRTILAAEVSGLVSALPVDEGDRVEKGQAICQLREDQRRLAVQEAEGRLSQLEDGVFERSAELRKAAFEAERMEGLYKLERCTEKEFRDAMAEHEAAQGRQRQAAHAVVSQQALLDRLKDDLERMSIRAPFDGVVVSKRTEVGSWVDQGGAVVELIDLSTARVRVNVPESAAGWCKPGEAAVVFLDALGRSFEGRVARRIPDADPQARTVPVEVDVANEDGLLMAGMFARVAVPNGPRARSLVVPKDAVVVRGQQQVMFVVTQTSDGTMATPMAVTIISEIGDRVAVSSEGLTEAARVVVRGNEYMFGPTPIALPAGKPSDKSSDGGESAGASGAPSSSGASGASARSATTGASGAAGSGG